MEYFDRLACGESFALSGLESGALNEKKENSVHVRQTETTVITKLRPPFSPLPLHCLLFFSISTHPPPKVSYLLCHPSTLLYFGLSHHPTCSLCRLTQMYIHTYKYKPIPSGLFFFFFFSLSFHLGNISNVSRLNGGCLLCHILWLRGYLPASSSTLYLSFHFHQRQTCNKNIPT